MPVRRERFTVSVSPELFQRLERYRQAGPAKITRSAIVQDTLETLLSAFERVLARERQTHVVKVFQK